MTNKVLTHLGSAFKLTVFSFTFFCVVSVGQQRQKIGGNPHKEWPIFWKTFRQRVLDKDSIGVANLVAYPFVDANTIYKGNATLTATNREEFLANYSQLFLPHTIATIKNNKYRTYNSKGFVEMGGDQLKKGE